MEKKVNKSVFVVPAVYIVLGLVMVIFPETTEKTFCLALGAIAAFLGIISLVTYFSRDVEDSVYRYDFVNGVMLLLLGLFFIVKMEMVIKLIPIMLGVMILGNGIIKLQHAIDLKRIDFNGWLYVLVFSLLCLSVGAVCIFRPAFIADTLIILMGISFLFCGITDFITLFLMSRRIKEYSREKDEAAAEKENKKKDKKADKKEKHEKTEDKKFDFKSAFKKKDKDTEDVQEQDAATVTEELMESYEEAAEENAEETDAVTAETPEISEAAEIPEMPAAEGSEEAENKDDLSSTWAVEPENPAEEKNDHFADMSSETTSDAGETDTEEDGSDKDQFGERNEVM